MERSYEHNVCVYLAAMYVGRTHMGFKVHKHMLYLFFGDI